MTLLASLQKILHRTRATTIVFCRPRSVLVSVDTAELIRSRGYQAEEHKYTTEDGYILTMHRIPQGRGGKKQRNLPLILQHGLWSSSSDWAIPGPDKSLAFLFANNGFDVWIPNSRGNLYSREHITYPSSNHVKNNEKNYWDFSWHEMGYYDLPSTIDYVLSTTGHSQLYYVGHSQGTTIFFVLASTKPEYNDKVRAMVALAPVAFLSHIRNPFLKKLSGATDFLFSVASRTGNYKMPLPIQESILKKVTDIRGPMVEKIAGNALDNLCAYPCPEVKENLLQIVRARLSSGASMKQLAHFGQITRQDFTFTQFDYGRYENYKIYGQGYPPEYNLMDITTPVYFLYSEGDWLVSPEDARMLYENIPNKLGMQSTEDPSFNHLDFIWSTKTKEIVFDKIIKVFSSQF